MAFFTTIAAALKVIGFTGGFVKDLRKQKLDFELAAKNSENEAQRNENEHQAKVIGMQLDDIQDARDSARALPRSLLICMVIASAAAVLWFVSGVFRSLYGYAEVNQLESHLWEVVKIIFQFLFGAGIVLGAARTIKS